MREMIRIILFTGLILSLPLIALAQSSSTESKIGTGVISGKVSLGGNPARGVTVIAVREDYDEKLALARLGNFGSMDITLKVKTDEEGHFRFTELPAASYRIFVSAPAMIGVKAAAPKSDSAPKSANAKLNKPAATTKSDEEDEEEDLGDSQATRAAMMEGAHRFIQLGEGQTVENLNFSLARGCVITGRVTYADGRPVIGEMISASRVQENQPSNTYPLNLGDDTFVTDDRGIYRLFGLADGRYKVSVVFRSRESLLGVSSPSSHKRTYYPNVTDEASAAVVEVAGGNEVRGIDIKLGASVKTFVVTGRVVDADTNKPVPNVSLVYERARNSGGEVNSNGLTEADAKGEFRFESVPNGSYMAYSLDGLLKQSEYYGESTKFEVKDANLNNVILKVRRGATLSGVIVLEGNPDAQVTALLAQQTLMAVSGMNEKLLEDNADGERAGMGFSIAQSPIAADGSFQLKGLRAGKVQIGLGNLLRESSFAVTRVERSGAEVIGGLELKANDNLADLRVYVAQKNCVLRGQVRIEGGSLPKNTRLHVTARRLNQNSEPGGFNLFEGMKSDNIQTDANGQFRFDNLIPGEYEVSILGSEQLHLDDDTPTPDTKQRVTVSSDREAEVTLVLNLKTKK